MLASFQCAPITSSPSRAQVGGPKLRPSQAHAEPKLSPSWAQAGPKPGPRWAQAGPKPDIWDPNKLKKHKFSKSKSVLPKMSARSGLAGKKTSRPHLGPSQAIFCVGRKNRKNTKQKHYFPWWASGPYSSGLGPKTFRTTNDKVRHTAPPRDIMPSEPRHWN